jgi:probable F420-dependent oxidoreductase
MQLGTSFPTTEIGNDPQLIRHFGTSVEDIGFQYLTCIDHVIQGPTPVADDWRAYYTLDNSFHEAMVVLGFLAGATRSLGLVTAILILPQRPAVLAAKQFAELDILTGGRVRAGVGIGWNELEFEPLHQSFPDRAARMEEQIEVMRSLWTQPTVNMSGRWHTIQEAGINPLPTQRPIPVWIGAFVPAAIRRAGRIADGLFLNPRATPTDAIPLVKCLHDSAREAGRDPSSLGLDATLLVGDKSDDEMVAEGQAWRELGATHLTVRTMNASLPSIDDHLSALQNAHALLAHLQD